MNRVLSVIGILALFAGIISAEATGRLRGKVLDPSGKAIEKVTIKIEYQGEMTQVYTATSNAKGEYVHIGIRPGKYRLTPSKEGFKPVEFAYYDVQIPASDKAVVVDMKMEAEVVAAAPQAATSQEAASTESPAASIAKDSEAAVGLLNTGKVNEAVAAFEKLVEANPTNAGLHYNLGVAYEKRDQYEKARDQYEEAIKIKPDFGDAFLAIGNTFMAQKNFNDAITPLTKAVELLPQNYGAAYNLGASYANGGMYAEAEGAFRKAVAINPKEPYVHQQLGMALLGQSKKDEGIAELQKYLELNPNAADKADILELIKSL
jgi:tetratricopeptide (TPR) repeat protein